jgi:hypothetical protein
VLEGVCMHAQVHRNTLPAFCPRAPMRTTRALRSILFLDLILSPDTGDGARVLVGGSEVGACGGTRDFFGFFKSTAFSSV